MSDSGCTICIVGWKKSHQTSSLDVVAAHLDWSGLTILFGTNMADGAQTMRHCACFNNWCECEIWLMVWMEHLVLLFTNKMQTCNKPLTLYISYILTVCLTPITYASNHGQILRIIIKTFKPRRFFTSPQRLLGTMLSRLPWNDFLMKNPTSCRQSIAVLCIII